MYGIGYRTPRGNILYLRSKRRPFIFTIDNVALFRNTGDAVSFIEDELRQSPLLKEKEFFTVAL